jgi:hypothetical protein
LVGDGLITLCTEKLELLADTTSTGSWYSALKIE